MVNIPGWWVGVDPHVPTHEREHHAVKNVSGKWSGWQTSACAMKVALIVHRAQAVGGYAGQPLPFDPALGTCCPRCVEAALGRVEGSVTPLRPQAS